MSHRKNIIITIVAVALILIGLLGGFFLNEDIADRFVTIITTGTAIVGAIALFYQFKRDKNLHEASFPVEYSNQFYAPPPDLLAGLIEDQIVVAEGEKKSRIYKLKEKASM